MANFAFLGDFSEDLPSSNTTSTSSTSTTTTGEGGSEDGDDVITGSGGLNGRDAGIIKADLPLWLARTLASRNMVQISTPRCFGARARANLSADPAVVNLNELNPYFYKFATLLLQK